MKLETSCGAVVFTRESGQIHYLLIHQTGGHWGFPKGHVEPGETRTQTALREIFEETGLRVTLLEGFHCVSRYFLPIWPNTMKHVHYFLGEFAGQQVTVQECEVSEAALLPYPEALEMLTHEDSRRLLTLADDFLHDRRPRLRTQEQLVDLLESNPALYIGSHGIAALDQFLGGYALAQLEENPMFDNWLQNEFTPWLAEKYHDTRTLNWCGLIRAHEPDGDSTDAFFRLVREFRAQSV